MQKIIPIYLIRITLFLSIILLSNQCTKDESIPSTPFDGPAAGNPQGTAQIPVGADLEDVSDPDVVVGDGTPESCTCDAFVNAVAQGGKITFNCGEEHHTIVMNRPAKVFNNANPDVIIDGGDKIALSGNDLTRILYMNTCDQAQVWTTSNCQNQDHPRLTVQNLIFTNGNSKNETDFDGGGAIWVRGGRFKMVNCRFYNNVCADVGPDVGGAAVRVFDQYNRLPIFVTNCTFGGAEGYGNTGANGGAISSIGQSWTITNSLFTHNKAIGNGGNPAQAGTPGGGSGGAIYNDGNYMTLSLDGTMIKHNEVNTHGSSIFFVSNDSTGNISIANSTIQFNMGGTWYPIYPSISCHSSTTINVTNSTIE